MRLEKLKSCRKDFKTLESAAHPTNAWSFLNVRVQAFHQWNAEGQKEEVPYILSSVSEIKNSAATIAINTTAAEFM